MQSSCLKLLLKVTARIFIIIKLKYTLFIIIIHALYIIILHTTYVRAWMPAIGDLIVDNTSS